MNKNLSAIIENINKEITVGIILTYEEIDMIVEKLRLKSLNEEQIKEIFLKSMMYCGKIKSTARENGDWETFDTYSNLLSKITTAINYYVAENN